MRIEQIDWYGNGMISLIIYYLLFMMKKILILSLFAIVVISGCSKPQPQACTEEAKICPDGSAVGRIGPNCEFAPCLDWGL